MIMNNITDENGRELQKHGEPEFPCDTSETAGTGFPWHWHDELETIHVLKGELIIAAGKERYRVKEGDAVLINSGVPHCLMPENGQWYEECDLVFHPSFISGGYGSIMYGRYLRPFMNNGEVQGIKFRADDAEESKASENIRKAYLLFHEKPRFYEFSMRENLSEVIMKAIDMSGKSDDWYSVEMRRVSERVKEAMKYIDKMLAKPVTAGDISEHIHVSERECQREFKIYLGITPHQYLTERRLTAAASMLMEGDKNINEISYDCGFNDTSSFIRQFRKRYDRSPNEYRKASF
jgi:AraC-like DNA-binding protein